MLFVNIISSCKFHILKNSNLVRIFFVSLSYIWRDRPANRKSPSTVLTAYNSTGNRTFMCNCPNNYFNQYYHKSVPNPDTWIISLPKMIQCWWWLKLVAKISFLTIFPTFPMETICISGTDYRRLLFFKLDCHHMFQSLFCNPHEVIYKIWKDISLPKGAIFGP